MYLRRTSVSSGRIIKALLLRICLAQGRLSPLKSPALPILKCHLVRKSKGLLKDASQKKKKKKKKRCISGGAWVAQSVKHLTLAQVMISQFMGSSPASGSVLTARSVEPESDSVSPSLSAPPSLTCLYLFLKNK